MHPIYSDMSEAELLVCNYLKKLKIFWQFNYPVFMYDQSELPRIFHPDFFLPEFGLYIEVMGNPKKPDYERRFFIYQKNHIPIIFIAPFHNNNWQNDILNFIENIHNDRFEKLKRIRNNNF